MRATKTIVPLSDGEKALYITIMNFKNEEEQQTIYKKINELIIEWNSKWCDKKQ